MRDGDTQISAWSVLNCVVEVVDGQVITTLVEGRSINCLCRIGPYRGELADRSSVQLCT